MKVLYVNQWGGLGGAEISLLRVLERLPPEEVQPLLVCPPGALAEEARAIGVEVVSAQLPSLRHGGRANTADIQRLRSAMASCDLVHAYSIRAGWFAGRLCRQLRLPMVWSIHDLFPFPWQRLWLRVVAQRYACVVVAYSQILQKQFGERLKHKVHLVPHGVDVQTFVPLEARQRSRVRRSFGTPADVPVVLHVGRLMPFKGQHLFLQMAQTLLRKYPENRPPVFWLAGDDSMGDRRYAVKIKAMSKPMEPHVRWLGFQRVVAPLIASADVLVHCSTRPEPFGLVILEAMACGTVVVSANRGASVEIIENGRTGVLTSPNDVAALAEAVQALLTDREQRQSIATSARQTVCDRYTLEQHVQRLLDIYRALL